MTDYAVILKKEVVPALGCTEPIAVAYAAACAARALAEPVEEIEVLASRNILKNAMSVGIPGSDMAGIPIAAALGALGGDAEAGLEVLHTVQKEHVEAGKRMIASGKIRVSQKSGCESVYVEVRVKGNGHSASAVIQRTHTNVTDVVRDGRALRHEALAGGASAAADEPEMTVGGIWRYCQDAPVEELAFLKEGVEMNLNAAQVGLKGGYGMSVGHNIAQTGVHTNVLGTDMGTCAVATTAAACDARMAGAPVPVMSVAGSGNQGLVCTLPVAVFADKLHSSEEKLLRAIALSDLVTVHIKQGIGRLSALCGCGIAAAVGASCGILYLLGGNEKQVQYTIKNMVANITGMVCDGAKSGCAVKVATAVSAAVQCAVLAMNNVHAPSIDGIVDRDVEKTIDNLGSVGREGMAMADQLILDLMTAKTV